MAKTIKFNLILDGQQVRCIEDLQDNFCVEDVMRLYQDGLLQKWLKVRGYDDYLQQVEAIKSKDSVIVELIKIFKIETKENAIKESLYSLDYRKKRETELKKWEESSSKVEKAIVDYHKGYESLKSKVIENKHDMAFMKATAKEISKYYYRLFKLDYTKFYYDFMGDAPLMIYAILMTPTLRDSFLQNNVVYKNLIKAFKIKSKDEAIKLICPDLADKIDKVPTGKLEEDFKDKLEKNDIAGFIKDIINIVDPAFKSATSHLIKEAPSDHKDAKINKDEVFDKIMQSIGLHIFTGETQSYWKDLQTEDTKVMIISVPDNCHIRGAKDKLEDIPSKDANDKFLILDGLAYKSSDTYNPLVYLEI